MMANEFTVYCSTSNWGTFHPTSLMVAQLPNGVGDLNNYEMAITSAHLCFGFCNITDVTLTLLKFGENKLETDRIEIVIPRAHNENLENLYDQFNTILKGKLEEGETIDEWAK